MSYGSSNAGTEAVRRQLTLLGVEDSGALASICSGDADGVYDCDGDDYGDGEEGSCNGVKTAMRAITTSSG